MKRKDKKKLFRIIAAAVIFAAIFTAEHFSLIPRLTLFDKFDVLPLLLYIIPYSIIGYDIVWRAIRNIIRGQVFDENFLMAIATVGAFVTGEYHESVFVMLFYQVGELFQSIAVGKSRNAIKSLLSIRADTAFIEKDDGELIEIACEEIQVGDVVCVKAGGKIPLDGVIIEGNTALDTIALTGESLPRDAHVGDTVLSGCVNLQGFIKIKVSKPFEESTVSKILSLVEGSAANKAKSEEFITKFARVYTPIVVIAAALLAVLPPLFIGVGDLTVWKEWILRAMTFLVISCPCALVISVPLSYFGGIGSASTKGILVKGSNYLDALSRCDTVVLDKTGTLTEGVFEVSEIHPQSNFTREYLLSLAASAEKHSTHPIAVSILRAQEAEKRAVTPEVANMEEMAGLGIKAETAEGILLAGNYKLMAAYGITMLDNCKEEQGTAVHVALNGIYVGHIMIADRIKSDAKEAISSLHAAGVKRTIMLTGDRETVARYTAEQLGIDEYHADLLPQDKVSAIESHLSKSGNKLIFVGDGINDAPVLARADVGIAMGALGSDAAIEAADIVLMNDDLKKIGDAILLSRRTRRIVIENIVFALGIKIAVLILGALGLVGLNAAVFADVGVAVIAILNSMRNLKK